MAKNEDYLSILCLHSTADEEWKDLFSEHLERLTDQSTQHIQHIEFQSVESYLDWYIDQDDILEQVDVVLLLLSVDFLNAEYTDTHTYRNLFKWHHKERLMLIPILLREVDMTDTEIEEENLILLPYNEEPLSSDRWSDPDHALTELTAILKELFFEQLTKKQQVARAWEMAKNMNTIQYYDNFLRNYPFSVHSGIAREKRDDLLETKLWKTALRNNSVEDYLAYLNNAPLRKKEREAKENILTIESSEEATWGDAINNDHPAFYLHYKTHFDNAAKNEIANQGIINYLKSPIDEDGQPIDLEGISEEDEEFMLFQESVQFDTQTKFLTYKAFHQLQPNELLSLLLHKRYLDHLQRRVSRIVGGLNGVIGQWQLYVYILMGSTMLFGFMLLLYDRVWDALSIVLKLGIPFILLSMAALILFIVLPQVRSDINYCKKRQQRVRDEEVGVKIAFLTYDEFEKRAILQRLIDIERQIEVIRKKERMDYIRFW
ncbi:MAG: hypothetical protein AAGI23_18365 [Bacteroidota bacterium]